MRLEGRGAASVCVSTYRGGVLLLFVQLGAAFLLAVAVLLQRVEHLVGQLQVHPQAVAHMDLRSELQEEEEEHVKMERRG